MSEHLLVIEDAPAIAKVIEKLGLSLGYRVTIAKTLGEVKPLLEVENDYFVATIDYMLPDAPNGEAIQFVLQYNIPSIVMTGRMDEKTRNEMLNLPLVDYITKESSQAFHYLLRVLNNQLTNREISVLVADGSLASSNHICNLLKRRNFKVFDVANGRDALILLNEHPEIKLVIIDHAMSDMSGLELVQKIRKDHAQNELIIIGLSGANKSSESARFIKNGADDFLRTPFSPEEFYCRIMQNIEQLQYIEKIKNAANQDYLTSLYNRRYFLEQAQVIQKNIQFSPKTHVLAFVYIDDFKRINEQISHEVGDSVLSDLSEQLSRSFEGALIARFGGAEFGLLLQGSSESAIKTKLDQFRKEVKNNTSNTKEFIQKYTVSIGATALSHTSEINKSMKEADKILYQAVNAGGNNTVMAGFLE